MVPTYARTCIFHFHGLAKSILNWVVSSKYTKEKIINIRKYYLFIEKEINMSNLHGYQLFPLYQYHEAEW